MKPAHLALLALAVVASQLPISGVHAQSTLVIDCPTHHLPTQQAVANALGLHNFGQTYAARQGVMETAKRVCLRGASRVIFNGNNEALQTTRKGRDQGRLAATNGSH